MGNRSTIASVRVRSSALTVTTEGQPSELSEPTQFPAPYAVYLPFISNTSNEDTPSEDTPTMGTMVYSSRLRRYPYLTDLVGPYVTINWATDTSSTTGFVTYGLMGSEGERLHSRQAMREFLLSQKRYWNSGNDAGRYNAVYPNVDGKRDIPDFTLLVPDWIWRYYLETGDKALLEETYPAILATADYVRRHIAKDGPTEGLVTKLSVLALPSLRLGKLRL